MIDPRTPVIVGAAQVTPNEDVHDGPIALAAEALRLAAADTGVGDRLIGRADVVGHVATVCWPYSDEAALVAQELGIHPRQTIRTARFGGDGPGLLLADTARAIGAGELDVALLSGAEAMATLRRAQKAGAMPEWASQDSSATPSKQLGTERPGSSEAEMVVGLIAPVYDYALLETAIQARLRADRRTHSETIARLWSQFSEVAADNPHAKLRQRIDPEALITPSPSNRPISAPYTKLLTANIGVDQATGLILASAQAAADAGISRDRWVFPLAVGLAHDEWFVTERHDLAASPAIKAAGAAALSHADRHVDELAYVDLYSCFPSAVQIAATELGLDPRERRLSLTGGLTFAGGPGNNYSSHAIATLVGRLREDPEGSALSSAVGWYVTKHAIVVLGGQPPGRPFRTIEATPETPPPRRAIPDYTGVVPVEAYTAPYAQDGAPEAVIVTALTEEGDRALARTSAPDVIQMVLDEDPLGHLVTLRGGKLEKLD